MKDALTNFRSIDELTDDAIYIIRWAGSNFKKPAIMWSTGKDSTVMLHLVRTAFFGNIPYPVIHLDTECKFPEIYEYRDKMVDLWGLDLIVGKNEKALKEKMNVNTHSHYDCCTALKTQALKQVLVEHGFDALIMSIRRDEHYIRDAERTFSPRTKEGFWKFIREKSADELKEGDAPFVSEQQPELWNLYQTDFGPEVGHVRVHPILNWNEIDVWRYIKQEHIPVNPLYFADYVKNKYGWEGKRFRSLGCKPCTNPVSSTASTLDEIIQELATTRVEERSGRAQDKEDEHNMRRMRSMGYM